MYSCTCPHCAGNQPTIVNAASADMQKEAERIAKGLYQGSITSGTIDPALTKLVAVELRKAVIEGFGKDLPEVDYNTPDYNMLIQLEKNVFHFSAAKDYQQLKSMSMALRDKDGKVRKWTDFRNEALQISDEYLGKHLRTEYDTAIGSATMAGKWVDIEQNKASAPLLRYDTVGDARVRPAHKELDGVIRPVEDSFWDTYYPPNGWRCRCDATQLLHGEPTPAHSIKTPDDVPAIFQSNMAAEGLAFPKDHPYYVDMPANLLKKAEALRNNVYSPITKTKAMEKNVFVSNMADPNDVEQNIQLAKRLAEFGEEVRIRPHVDEQGVKNPELQLGSLRGDFKVFEPGRSSLYRFLKNSIASANNQEANIPVFVIPNKHYDRQSLLDALHGELKDDRKKNISHVWLLMDKELITIKRADVVKRKLEKILP